MPFAPYSPLADFPELLPIIAGIAITAFSLGALLVLTVGGMVARHLPRPSIGDDALYVAQRRRIGRLEEELQDSRNYANRLIADPDFLLTERMHRRLPVGPWRVYR